MTTNAAEAAARSYCNEWIGLDIAIKAIGMLLSMTIFSQAMMWAVLFTAVIIVVPKSIKKTRYKRVRA